MTHFAEHEHPPIPWPAAEADFVLSLAVDELPAAPWEFGPGRTIVDNEKFLASMQLAARIGPSSPVGFYGALQQDLQRLADLYGLRLAATPTPLNALASNRCSD